MGKSHLKTVDQTYVYVQSKISNWQCVYHDKKKLPVMYTYRILNNYFQLLHLCFLPVNGGWCAWEEGPCTRKCGPGRAVRVRRCACPVPARGGRPCRGTSLMKTRCQVRVCDRLDHSKGQQGQQHGRGRPRVRLWGGNQRRWRRRGRGRERRMRGRWRRRVRTQTS